MWHKSPVFVWMKVAALVIVALLAWQHLSFYLLTRSWVPIKVSETLEHPVKVSGWNTDGLHLADGRMVQLPGIQSLPPSSPALDEVIKRGVELRPDGRVIGLVRVHHWCGNDPVIEEIARVDISEMMRFLRVGEPQTAVAKGEILIPESLAGGTFSKWGWRIDEYLQLRGREARQAPAVRPSF
jgi:hypothetical protein